MEISDIIRLIVTGSRHPDYERVCKLATDYRAWVTGNGLDGMLKKIVKRESDDDFAMRKQLTAHIIPSAVNRAKLIYTKGLRSNAVNLFYSHIDEQKTKDLSANIAEFYGMKDVRAYLDQFCVDMMFTDPNAWLICETGGTDGEQYAKSYPYIVACEDALDFKLTNGVLEWLFVKASVVVQDGGKTKQVAKYTLYGNDRAIIAQQIIDETITRQLYRENTAIEVNGTIYFKDKDNNTYQLIEPLAYNVTAPVAYRWGYIYDTSTMHRTFVSALEAARPYIEKSLKAVSELDLAATLHAFPQKVEYAPRCQYDTCRDGRLSDGSDCPKCHGTGFEISHSSSQDVVRLALPRDPSTAFQLSNLITYVSLPIEILKFQNTYVHELAMEIQKSIFISDKYTIEQLLTTATAEKDNMQAIYDTLYPFAVQYSELWSYIIWQTAEYMKISEGLTITKIVKQDFKLKTFNEVMADLSAAKAAGVDVSIINGLSDDIAAIQYKDDPAALRKHEAMQRFNPFNDKSDNEKMAIVSSLPLDNDLRVLYTFYGQIFNDIDVDKPEFYSLSINMQRNIMAEYVAKYKTMVSSIAPPDFNE